MIDFGFSESGSTAGNLAEKAFQLLATKKAQKTPSAMSSWTSTPTVKGAETTKSVSSKNASTGVTASKNTSTGATTSKKTASGKNSTSFDYEKEADKLKAAEKKRKEEMEKKLKASISSSFDPIYAELDRQLSLLPSRQTDAEARVETLTGEQLASVEREKAAGQAQLESSRGKAQEQSQSSIRDLEADIRNQLSAKAKLLGSIGAGSSSAVDAVSEAVTRQGLRSKADILSTRDAALAEIEGMSQEVNNLASEQIANVQSWRSQAIYEVATDFQDKMDQINQAKASASVEEAKALSDLAVGLETQFNSVISQIESSVLSYSEKIDTWQKQRAADIEDYATKLGIQANYTGGAQDMQKMAAAIGAFQENLKVAQGDAELANSLTTKQGFIDPFTGLSDEEKKRAMEGYVTLWKEGKITQLNPSEQLKQASASAQVDALNSGAYRINPSTGAIEDTRSWYNNDQGSPWTLSELPDWMK